MSLSATTSAEISAPQRLCVSKTYFPVARPVRPRKDVDETQRRRGHRATASTTYNPSTTQRCRCLKTSRIAASRISVFHGPPAGARCMRPAAGCRSHSRGSLRVAAARSSSERTTWPRLAPSTPNTSAPESAARRTCVPRRRPCRWVGPRGLRPERCNRSRARCAPRRGRCHLHGDSTAGRGSQPACRSCERGRGRS